MKTTLLILLLVATCWSECYTLGDTTYCNTDTETGKPLVNK